MGLSSWFTQDTGESIATSGSRRKTFTVHMVDDKGNVWTEKQYEGYGKFGGKDYFELVAEMNGVSAPDNIQSPEEYTEHMRLIGIDIAFGPETGNKKFPNLIRGNPKKWEYTPVQPEYSGWIQPESYPDQDYRYHDGQFP